MMREIDEPLIGPSLLRTMVQQVIMAREDLLVLCYAPLAMSSMTTGHRPQTTVAWRRSG